MERERIIQDLHGQIETLTRLHIQHGLDKTEHFQTHKDSISDFINKHGIDVRSELDPVSRNLYRRYFD